MLFDRRFAGFRTELFDVGSDGNGLDVQPWSGRSPAGAIGWWKQKTAADRFRRALKRIGEWCRRYRHEPDREQWAALKL